jgi:hypothetical protein
LWFWPASQRLAIHHIFRKKLLFKQFTGDAFWSAGLLVKASFRPNSHVFNGAGAMLERFGLGCAFCYRAIEDFYYNEVVELNQVKSHQREVI